MPRGASLSAAEVAWIKAEADRIQAIKAEGGKRYPRQVWEYVQGFTGRPERPCEAS